MSSENGDHGVELAKNGEEFDDMDDFYGEYPELVNITSPFNGTGNYTRGDDDDGLKDWMIVLIVLAVLFVVLLIILAAIFLYKYKSKSRVLPTTDKELGASQEPINYLTNEAVKGKSYRPTSGRNNNTETRIANGGDYKASSPHKKSATTDKPKKKKKKKEAPAAEATAASEATENTPDEAPSASPVDTAPAATGASEVKKKKKKKKPKQETKYASNGGEEQKDEDEAAEENENKQGIMKRGGASKPLPPIKSNKS